jgi:hypothetical protein
MYQDVNGNQFHSFEEACIYYGVDTPAQVAAEDAYWAAEEANEDLDRRFNEALIYDRDMARWTLRDEPASTYYEEEMPF